MSAVGPGEKKQVPVGLMVTSAGLELGFRVTWEPLEVWYLSFITTATTPYPPTPPQKKDFVLISPAVWVLLFCFVLKAL